MSTIIILDHDLELYFHIFLETLVPFLSSRVFAHYLIPCPQGLAR